jgi:hypothetical protein
VLVGLLPVAVAVPEPVAAFWLVSCVLWAGVPVDCESVV